MDRVDGLRTMVGNLVWLWEGCLLLVSPAVKEKNKDHDCGWATRVILRKQSRAASGGPSNPSGEHSLSSRLRWLWKGRSLLGVWDKKSHEWGTDTALEMEERGSEGRSSSRRA